MAEPLRALGIFPHPDDEVYSCAGTIALLSDQGAQVHVLCATDGESGQDRSGSGAPARRLGATRREELACSCRVLGAAPPHFLGLQDGHLSDVDFPAVVSSIVGMIRLLRPHLLLTLGSDGAYGHPDHLALYRLVVAAVAASGGGDRFPESQLGAAWTPRRHFAAAFPVGMFRPMYEHMLYSEYSTAIRGLDPEHLGVEPAAISASIDIRGVAERKLSAIRCHASQLKDGDPATLFPGDLVRRLLGVELFTLVSGESSAQRLRDLAEGITT